MNLLRTSSIAVQSAVRTDKLLAGASKSSIFLRAISALETTVRIAITLLSS